MEVVEGNMSLPPSEVKLQIAVSYASITEHKKVKADQNLPSGSVGGSSVLGTILTSTATDPCLRYLHVM